jgi:hypothetical protein
MRKGVGVPLHFLKQGTRTSDIPFSRLQRGGGINNKNRTIRLIMEFSTIRVYSINTDVTPKAFYSLPYLSLNLSQSYLIYVPSLFYHTLQIIEVFPYLLLHSDSSALPPAFQPRLPYLLLRTYCFGFEVLKAETTNSKAFGVVTPCSVPPKSRALSELHGFTAQKPVLHTSVSQFNLATGTFYTRKTCKEPVTKFLYI